MVLSHRSRTHWPGCCQRIRLTLGATSFAPNHPLHGAIAEEAESRVSFLRTKVPSSRLAPCRLCANHDLMLVSSVPNSLPPWPDYPIISSAVEWISTLDVV